MKHSKPMVVIAHTVTLTVASLLMLASSLRPSQPDMVTLTGTVVDPRSMAPLAGARISWGSRTAISDTAGSYELTLPAGVRNVLFSRSDRPSVTKVLIIPQPGARLRLDVLLPDTKNTSRMALALDRGPAVGSAGKDLDSDVAADSTISLADEYGNNDRLLALNFGSARVRSPVWLDARTIAFGKEAHAHRTAALGVFTYRTDSAAVHQIASVAGVQSLSTSPRTRALAVATQKELYVTDGLSDTASVRRIFNLEANKGFLLSVAWAPDDRIYFTIDDSIQLDERHYLTKSRIASVRPDGSDLDPHWAADTQYSYRYPIGAGAKILFCRFALDGTQQSIWSRNTRTGRTEPLFEPGLRAVHLDSVQNRFYYIYRQALHFRDITSGADWIIANSVRDADYLVR